MRISTTFSLDSYVERLEKVSIRYADKNGAGFLKPNGEKECRKIGEEINAQWGYDGMVYVCDKVRHELGYAHYRELEAAWNRIGRWRS